MNINDRTVERIDAVLPEVSDPFERDKLLYVRGQLTPVGFLRRDEYSQAVDHLIEVADQIMKSYERRVSRVSVS